MRLEPSKGQEMFERSFKVIFLGGYATGKTSLINRFLGNNFSLEYIPSVKTSVSVKKFIFKNYALKTSFWDREGGSELAEDFKNYCANAQAAIAVFDICRRSSLSDAEIFLKAMFKFSKPIVWLVGNKIDLKKEEWFHDGKLKKRQGN